MSGEQELGITESERYNTGERYTEVVRKAGLANYGPEGMSGFIVTRPRGYALWGSIQNYLDGKFKRTGVQNAYFPLFIPESCLERERSIIKGLGLKVTWVTHGGHEELGERLAVHPTSESIITPYMAQWIRNHRDLPLRMNRRAFVTRWGVTETKPFFRTKELFQQEGHTAYETRDGVWDETMTRLSQYRSLYEDVLTIPVLHGARPEYDKSPGVDTATTVEALMPDGKSMQADTSHYLGTSFAGAFGPTYITEDEDEEPAHTTSRGLSWRSLGVPIMTYLDDQGPVLSSTVAPEQVIIVPTLQAGTQEKVLDYAKDIAEDLEGADVCIELDVRGEYNPGFKFNEQKLKSIPIRFEIGPNGVDDDVVTAVHRPDGDSVELDRENIAETAQAQFDEVYAKLYATVEENLEESIHEASEYSEILGTIGQYDGYMKTSWCGDEACEDEVKE